MKSLEKTTFYQYVQPVFFDIFKQHFSEQESEEKTKQVLLAIQKELGGVVCYIPRHINQYEKRNAILADYKKGANVQTLARKYKVSFQYIYSVIKQPNL